MKKYRGHSMKKYVFTVKNFFFKHQQIGQLIFERKNVKIYCF